MFILFYCHEKKHFLNTLLVIQLVSFAFGAITDDISWGLKTYTWEALSISFLCIAIIVKIYRTWAIHGEVMFLFVLSQFNFAIPWVFAITLSIIFFYFLPCNPGEIQPEIMTIQNCVMSLMAPLEQTLFLSLNCNIKTTNPQLAVYMIVLAGNAIFDAVLLARFINWTQSRSQESFAVLYISIMIASWLIMIDLLYRGTYEKRELLEQKAQVETLTRMSRGISLQMALLQKESIDRDSKQEYIFGAKKQNKIVNEFEANTTDKQMAL